VRGVRVAIALGVLLIAVGLAHALFTHQAPFIAGNGRNIELIRGVAIDPGRRACQAGETVPPGAAALRISVSSAGKAAGPLEVTVTQGGRVRTSGRGAVGVVDSAVEIPLTTLRAGAAPATVCVANVGSRRVAILGQRVPGPPFATVSGERRAQRNAMRLEWFGPGRQTRAGEVGRVADRYGLFKPSFFGAWTFWVALAVLLAISVAAVRLVVREGRS
jgi:hypothetical protein